MSALLTVADVAGRLKVTESQANTLRRKDKWPHVALSRKAIRFTEEQVDQIVALYTKAPAPRIAAPTIAGQTKRSAARRSA